MRPIVHSVKHYVQTTLSEATTLAVNSEVYVTAVESTLANTSNEVEEGAVVKAVYIELWVNGSTQDQFFTIIAAKMPSGVGAPSFTNMTNLFAYKNKKNILYTTQGLAANESGANPVPIIRQWIKIPKGKQRFGLGDQFIVMIASRGTATINYCGFATYKEYS